MSRKWLFLGLGCLCLVLLPDGAAAQDIRFRGRADSDVERRLVQLLDAGGFETWTRDTVVRSDRRVQGDVLILEASVRISGHVTGDIFVVDGDLFLRPGAVVEGDVLVLGGGYYGSGRAEVDGEVDYRSTALYRVLPEAGGYLIYSVRPSVETVRLHGLSGFKEPRYQRVNGWLLEAGVTLQAGAPWTPSLALMPRYRTTQDNFGGLARLMWHPSSQVRFGLEAERRGTRHNEGWLRGSFSNTLAYLFAGDDFRNYYEADRVAFSFERVLSEGWGGRLRFQWEDARSLEARPHTVVFADDDPRPNPAVDPGDLWSVELLASLNTAGALGRLAGFARLEGADSTVAGDFSFLLGEAQLGWSLSTRRGHTLEVFGRARGDLAGTLPRQRWSGLGGRGTLPTFAILELFGPRSVYGQVTYLISLPSLKLGPLGVPEAFVREAVGAAWQVGDSASFEDNLLVGVRVGGAELALAIDPSEDDAQITFGFRLAGTP